MGTKPQPDLSETVTCEVCLKEVPRSEAKSEEAGDYFLYFCGLDCYEKWKLMSRDDDAPD